MPKYARNFSSKFQSLVYVFTEIPTLFQFTVGILLQPTLGTNGKLALYN